MGRRAQANFRTLSRAVKEVFVPVITDLPSLRKKPSADETPTSNGGDYLIPTQLDDESHSSTSALKRSAAEAFEDTEDGEVETRYTQSNIPPALKKYWYVRTFWRVYLSPSETWLLVRQQRYRLFSRYDEGIQMDYDGWFSVTPENIAAQIAERCRCGTVVDAFCGVGGNAIQFAFTCEKVIAIDNSPTRLACARANAKVYGVEENIEFVLADFVDWAKERAASSKATDEPIDVVFMSPPWGGIEYREPEEDGPSRAISALPPTGTLPAATYASYSLSRLEPLHGKELFRLARNITKNVAYFLPRNLDLHESAALVDSTETVEVEEEWMGSKLKALCLYYGDLATKQ